MDFWDRIADFYGISERINGAVYRKMTAAVRRLVPRGAKVLDCAAGTGVLSLAAAECAQSVVCTDLSEKMLANARKEAIARGFQNIAFEKRNIFDLKDEDESYDVVIAGNVLHLLDNPDGALKELCRATKRGGRIIVPTFMSKASSPFLMKIYSKLGLKCAHNWTPAQYKEMLVSADCGEVKMKLITGKIPCAFAVIKKPL